MGLVVLPHVRAADLAVMPECRRRDGRGAVTVDNQLESLVNGFLCGGPPHRQLVEDDAALHREIILVQARVGGHVGQRLDRHVQVGVANARQYAVCSRAVSALDSPPTLSKATAMSRAERLFVPLKRRCSSE